MENEEEIGKSIGLHRVREREPSLGKARGEKKRGNGTMDWHNVTHGPITVTHMSIQLFFVFSFRVFYIKKIGQYHVTLCHSIYN